MIQKLRRKFIAINMLLVSAVLLAVFAMQTLSTFRQAEERVCAAQVQALEWVSRSLSPSFVFDGRRPDEVQPPQLPEGQERDGEPGRRGRQDFPGIPAFAVEVDGTGAVTALRAGPGVEVTEETAQAMADEALAQGGGQGSLPGQNLSYLSRLENDRRFLAFADNSSVARAVRDQLLVSLLILSAALPAFYLISRFLAKVSLGPVETAWEQQRQFVADASHELKTPLAVILANTDIVLSHPRDRVEDQGKWIGYIREEAQRMRALVEDLLFLAKSDAQKLPSHPAQVRLDQLVTGCLLSFEPVAFEAGVTLTEDIAPGLTLTGDEGQLRRLVVILLDNAVKYAGEEKAVDVALGEVQGRLRLTVHNTGPAIPAQRLPHLFERFYRSDEARDRERGGYGLGLAIAQSIVQGHGGRIAVESREGEGTTFTVTLPKK